MDSTLSMSGRDLLEGMDTVGAKKNPPVVPGDKTKNKNYEQTLTLSDLSRFKSNSKAS